MVAWRMLPDCKLQYGHVSWHMFASLIRSTVGKANNIMVHIALMQNNDTGFCTVQTTKRHNKNIVLCKSSPEKMRSQQSFKTFEGVGCSDMRG